MLSAIVGAGTKTGSGCRELIVVVKEISAAVAAILSEEKKNV